MDGHEASHAENPPRSPPKPQRLNRLTASDEGMIFYPSGNIAVSVYFTPTGRVINFLGDQTSPQVLACFDEKGVGCVNHTNGNPWVVVSLHGWSHSDRKGNIQKTGGWPRNDQEAVICDVTENLLIEFRNRQSIVAKFSCEEVLKEFQCGEDLKRSDSYLSKVTATLPGGKLQMDIDAIRQRQKDVGSLYIPPGPHHTVTLAPGLGILRTLVKSLDESCLAQKVINDMSETQGRVRLLTKTTAKLEQTVGDFPEDFGKPKLSRTQRRFQSLDDGTKIFYTRRRAKLPILPMKDVESCTVGDGHASDTLVMLCVLADWNPVCKKLEARLEAANYVLQEERAANASSPAGHIQVFKVDASEGWTLQLRYDFRTVPMFLMYYGGKLVYASNAIRTKVDMLEAVKDNLTKGRKGIFLSERFSFRGRDNFVLDAITNEMSLLTDG